MRDTILHPDVIDRALAYAEASILNAQQPGDRTFVERELAGVERAIGRLTKAVASGDGDLSPLVDALQAQQQRKAELSTRIASLGTHEPVDIDAVREELRGDLADWQGLLRGHVAQAQLVLKRLIVGRLTVWPTRNGYAFEGVGTVRPLLAGVVRNVASPPGFEPGFQP